MRVLSSLSLSLRSVEASTRLSDDALLQLAVLWYLADARERVTTSVVATDPYYGTGTQRSLFGQVTAPKKTNDLLQRFSY